jgi:hypothetical protein
MANSILRVTQDSLPVLNVFAGNVVGGCPDSRASATEILLTQSRS